MMMYNNDKDKKTKPTRAQRKRKRKITRFTNQFIRQGVDKETAKKSAESLIIKGS